MYFLVFMDYLPEILVYTIPAILLCLSVYLILSPRVPRSWKKTTLRISGSALLMVTTLVSGVLFLGSLMIADPPREHLAFSSITGKRVALLSHSSLRDASNTKVTFTDTGCCNRYIAYEYQGDGDDYMGADSVKWIDDHHLVIRYALDPSSRQICRTQLSDVQILCRPQPTPTFDGNR